MSDSWSHRKANMQVATSRAEDRVHAELQRRRLTSGMVRDTVIFLDTGRVLRKEWVTKEMVRNRDWTVPDFLWPSKMLPVYLDGGVHNRRGVKNRDDRINDALRRLGFKPLRFGCSGHLSKRRLMEIVDRIEEAAKWRGSTESFL